MKESCEGCLKVSPNLRSRTETPVRRVNCHSLAIQLGSKVAAIMDLENRGYPGGEHDDGRWHGSNQTSGRGDDGESVLRQPAGFLVCGCEQPAADQHSRGVAGRANNV